MFLGIVFGFMLAVWLVMVGAVVIACLNDDHIKLGFMLPTLLLTIAITAVFYHVFIV